VVSANPPPKIVDFSPKEGYGGREITIMGNFLSSATTVAFNGASATFEIDEETIIAKAPENGSDGPITVTTPYGTHTSDSIFNYVDPTGINASLAQQMNVYPNPSYGRFTLSTTAMAFPGCMVSIKDVMGREIKKLDLSKVHSPELVIDISFVPAGIYFLYMEEGDEKWVQRIVKR
jgi:hypothetical protein